jgi:hypothetical protein
MVTSAGSEVNRPIHRLLAPKRTKKTPTNDRAPAPAMA